VRAFPLDAPENEGFQNVPNWSVDKTPVGQLEVGGAHGRFIDTWTGSAGDAATGEMWTLPFDIEGDAIELYVAGGDHPEAGVVLEVDGLRVAEATGCKLEVLGRRVWNVAPYRGHRAVLRIIDRTRSAWGHVVVDRITEWRIPPESRR
jgi:hypothetical protein